jgi:hypothetical protein
VNHLSDTLLQLFEAVKTPEHVGLYVTELDVQLPLEITTVVQDGELVFRAQPPHSRWQAGFLPPVQQMRMRLAVEET